MKDWEVLKIHTSVLLQVRMVETFRSCFAAISRAEACLDSVFLTFHSAGDLEACIEACFIFVSYTHISFATISQPHPASTMVPKDPIHLTSKCNMISVRECSLMNQAPPFYFWS